MRRFRDPNRPFKVNFLVTSQADLGVVIKKSPNASVVIDGMEISGKSRGDDQEKPIVDFVDTCINDLKYKTKNVNPNVR